MRACGRSCPTTSTPPSPGFAGSRSPVGSHFTQSRLMRRHLLLCLNGTPIRVTGADAVLTLSDFLRCRRRVTGTKVVCAEGDCGSCSVLGGRVEAGRIRYSAVTSCIQLMFQLDAAHVVTVEGLRRGS